MNDEKKPQPQTPTGDAHSSGGAAHPDKIAAARVDETAAARLDETDAGDWARSARPDGEANRDPITGEPGAHPVGAGVGAAGGAVTGMAVGGAVGGPLGAAIGAVVGGVAGGLAGKGVAEVVNPTVEDEYWRANYAKRPYAAGRAYEDLAPAYRYGWESRAARPESRWNEVEPDLERGWANARGTSTLAWNDIHDAVEEAWVRVDERLAGRPGRDPAGRAQNPADAGVESIRTRR